MYARTNIINIKNNIIFKFRYFIFLQKPNTDTITKIIHRLNNNKQNKNEFPLIMIYLIN